MREYNVKTSFLIIGAVMSLTWIAVQIFFYYIQGGKS